MGDNHNVPILRSVESEGLVDTDKTRFIALSKAKLAHRHGCTAECTAYVEKPVLGIKQGRFNPSLPPLVIVESKAELLEHTAINVARWELLVAPPDQG